MAGKQTEAHMTDAERVVAAIAETMAKTAELIAETLEASNSKMTGAQALRSFASAIRETNAKSERNDLSLH
jgi:hypothetical protein